MILYYLCKYIYIWKCFLKSWRNIYKWTTGTLIGMKEKFYFYSKLSSFFLCVLLIQDEFEQECILFVLNKHLTYDCTELAYHKNRTNVFQSQTNDKLRGREWIFAEGLKTEWAHEQHNQWNAGCTLLSPPVTRTSLEHLLGLSQPGNQLLVQGKSEFMPGP